MKKPKKNSESAQSSQKKIRLRLKSEHQEEYLASLCNNDVTLCLGPAGTGKTYIAVYKACMMLREEEVKRIVLSRPAIEAGEKLGYLPGDFKEKVDPYFRPLYDALHHFLGATDTRRLIDEGIIEVAPLAYMRGRTIHDAFMILDEAQNTTKAQMEMFLTRAGYGSKVSVNGDPTQNDLEPDVVCGLEDAQEVLEGTKGVGVVFMDREDIVRSEMTQRIVDAYAERGGAP